MPAGNNEVWQPTDQNKNQFYGKRHPGNSVNLCMYDGHVTRYTRSAMYDRNVEITSWATPGDASAGEKWEVYVEGARH